MPAKERTLTGRNADNDPAKNLMPFDDDFEEAEQGAPGATPRMYGPEMGGMLTVQAIDMCQAINKVNHYTDNYDTPNLVIRRGQEFIVKVTFNRLLEDQDDFQLEFLIGSNPSPNKDSLVVVTFGPRRGGPWAGRVLEVQGTTATLGVTPSPKAIVGMFRCYVAVLFEDSMHRTKRDPGTDVYVLFNAWCPEDAVFLPDEAERREYVLNDSGLIYQGTTLSMSQRPWMYGQFERGILDACIYILDASRMPIFNRGNVIKLVRKGSAMINSQDDNGVLVGNWSSDYSMGTPPTAWTGSVKILLRYANTGVPVCYAQCWVFAGVFNTFLRCLGIPSRVVTNFSSAHDNTGNLKTDLIFNKDGTPDRRHTRDSIWNYHCWNEVFMARPDLPPGLGGWQVVDSTPQETSDGHFRCGPASVAAIKDGLLCHPFDAGFVFAEVNSDVVFLKRDRYGTLTPFKVDTTHVGQAVYTKAVGSDFYNDVTHTYKYPEGSHQDAIAMRTAEEFGCERDHSDVPVNQLSVQLSVAPRVVGQDVDLEVSFNNQGDTPQAVQAHMEASVIFYTGAISDHFKDEDFVVDLQPYERKSLMLRVTAEEYIPRLKSQLSLHFVVTGVAGDQSMTDSKAIELTTPTLTIKVDEPLKVHREALVSVLFTNPLPFALYNVSLTLDGLPPVRDHGYHIIHPGETISWRVGVTPRLAGPRLILALLSCDQLPNVYGKLVADVGPMER